MTSSFHFITVPFLPCPFLPFHSFPSIPFLPFHSFLPFLHLFHFFHSFHFHSAHCSELASFVSCCSQISSIFKFRHLPAPWMRAGANLARFSWLALLSGFDSGAGRWCHDGSRFMAGANGFSRSRFCCCSNSRYERILYGAIGNIRRNQRWSSRNSSPFTVHEVSPDSACDRQILQYHVWARLRILLFILPEQQTAPRFRPFTGCSRGFLSSRIACSLVWLRLAIHGAANQNLHLCIPFEAIDYWYLSFFAFTL